MKYTIVCFFLLATVFAQAQSNYRPGYIITHENDTLSGVIDYRTDAMLARSCTFKAAGSEEKQVFKPTQISGFRFFEDGKYYVSRNITIKGKQQVVFLEYLVSGIMNLYFFAEERDQFYYIFEDQSGNMIPVTKRPNETMLVDGALKNVSDERYKHLVRYIFKDVEALDEEAEKIQFTDKAMIAITKNYHNQVCTSGEQCIVFETSEGKQTFKAKFAIYGGIQKIQTVNAIYLVRPRIEAHWSPLIGVQLNVSSPRYMKSISFQMDISATNANSHLLLNELASIRYTYHKGTIRPTIGIGVAFGQGHKSYAFSYVGEYVSIGLNIKIVKDQFIFCAVDYCAFFPQVKVGYIF